MTSLRFDKRITKMTRMQLDNLYSRRVQRQKDGKALTVLDTRDEIGNSVISDIICLFDYGSDDCPQIIIERINRQNYRELSWQLLRRRLVKMAEKSSKVCGYNVRVSIDRNKIEVIYSKKEWWLWLNSEL